MNPQLIYSTETIKILTDRYPHSKDNFIMFGRQESLFNKELTEDFQLIVNDIHTNIGHRRSPPHNSILKDHIEQLLLNLIRGISSVCYLGVYGNSNLYAKGSELYKANFSIYYLNLIFNYLVPNHLCKERGYLFRDEFYFDDNSIGTAGLTSMNKYYPEPELLKQLLPFMYLVGSSFKTPKTKLSYINIKKLDIVTGKDTVTPYYPRTEKLTQDRLDLEIINNYLQKQNFALKSPIKRIYSQYETRGGRLYTPIQNIPNNRAPIRKSLRINGKPMVEVDFKANHLAMCIALYEKDKYSSLPSDPYIEIIKTSGIGAEAHSKYRDFAKTFVTRSLGANTLQGAQNSFRTWQTNELHQKDKPTKAWVANNILFRKFNEAFKELFPNTNLFSDLGAQLQVYEGDIMMSVLLEGVEKDIPILPLHDACLCADEDREEVKSLMVKHWMSVLQTGLIPVVVVK